MKYSKYQVVSQEFFECNQEEGNTRITPYALQQKENVAVYSKDTDVLVLMVFSYALIKLMRSR